MNAVERFIARVDFRTGSDGCWAWNGGLHPYGQLFVDGKNQWAHRFAYEFVCGPLDEGVELHHTCRNKGCVNPDHLMALTREAHGLLDGRYYKTHCVRGHEFTSENTGSRPDGYRVCRSCARDNQRRYRAERAAA